MYEFTPDCMIHIDSIDDEHRKLFQMLNEAFALVKKQIMLRLLQRIFWLILRIMLLHILHMKRNT